MSERKDYRVTVKVRNNNLLRAVEAKGYEVGYRFAEDCGIGYGVLNQAVNMLISPLSRRTGLPLPWVESLIAFLGVPFEELFAEWQLTALGTNRSEREITAEQLFYMLGEPEYAQIEHDDGLHDATNAALETLTKREQRVIELRFGMNGEGPMTRGAIGLMLDLSAPRVAQIEGKALQKLRLSSCSGVLRDYLPDAQRVCFPKPTHVSFENGEPETPPIPQPALRPEQTRADMAPEWDPV